MKLALAFIGLTIIGIMTGSESLARAALYGLLITGLWAIVKAFRR